MNEAPRMDFLENLIFAFLWFTVNGVVILFF